MDLARRGCSFVVQRERTPSSLLLKGTLASTSKFKKGRKHTSTMVLGASEPAPDRQKQKHHQPLNGTAAEKRKETNGATQPHILENWTNKFRFLAKQKREMSKF